MENTPEQISQIHPDADVHESVVFEDIGNRDEYLVQPLTCDLIVKAASGPL